MSYETSIAGIGLDNCIYNAAGPKCTTYEHLRGLGESNSAAIMTKSCTFEAREGNEKPRYSDIDHGSINSMGLPNLGHKAYKDFVPEMKKYGKPVIISVSGMSFDENLKIVKEFNDTDADMIELNLSCPNIKGKPQVGYDFEQSDKLLDAVMDIAEKPLGVKLPPYFDFVHYQRMADVLNKHNVAFATCINSVGNGLYIDWEKETTAIRPKGGFGGIGGSYVKPVALANVRKFSELLDDSIDLIGVGGVYKGSDVFEYILAGAKAVQVGTSYMQEGTSIFDRLEKEFNEVMESKGYESIEEVRGKLKVL